MKESNNNEDKLNMYNLKITPTRANMLIENKFLKNISK